MFFFVCIFQKMRVHTIFETTSKSLYKMSTLQSFGMRLQLAWWSYAKTVCILLANALTKQL